MHVARMHTCARTNTSEQEGTYHDGAQKVQRSPIADACWLSLLALVLFPPPSTRQMSFSPLGPRYTCDRHSFAPRTTSNHLERCPRCAVTRLDAGFGDFRKTDARHVWLGAEISGRSCRGAESSIPSKRLECLERCDIEPLLIRL